MNLIYKNFKELSNDEHTSLLNIRNSDHVRLNTKTKKVITFEEHLSWIEKLKEDTLNIYYAVIENDKIIGSISITDINHNIKECSWGLYFKTNINPLVSSISAYLIIDRVFNFYDLTKLNLEVNKKNQAAYKFDLTLGFKVYDEKEELGDAYYLMTMSKSIWNTNSNTSLMSTIKKKLDHINYKFV